MSTEAEYGLIVPAEAPAADTGGLAHETNHSDYAVDRFTQKFKNKPRLEALLRAHVDQVQSIEDLLWDLLTKRGLNPVEGNGPAEGIHLDNLGEIVGEPRAEKDDAEYLTFLRVRILVNKSNGYSEELIAILDLIGFDTIKVEDNPPARILVTVTGATYPIETVRYLREAKAGGVGLDFIYSYDIDDETFQFSGTHGTVETDIDSGFDSAHNGTPAGGNFAGVF